MSTIAFAADVSELQAQVAELKRLCLEAGDIPESILQELRAVPERGFLERELEIFTATTAGDANSVLGLRLRRGGDHDRLCAALRALKLEGQR